MFRLIRFWLTVASCVMSKFVFRDRWLVSNVQLAKKWLNLAWKQTRRTSWLVDQFAGLLCSHKITVQEIGQARYKIKRHASFDLLDSTVGIRE